MSTDQTHISVVTDEALTVGLKSWSRGQKSQAASAICSGGVSAVMGSSDLDAHTLGSGGASGNQLSCSLPSGANKSIVEATCLARGPMRCASCARTARPDPRLVLRSWQDLCIFDRATDKESQGQLTQQGGSHVRSFQKACRLHPEYLHEVGRRRNPVSPRPRRLNETSVLYRSGLG